MKPQPARTGRTASQAHRGSLPRAAETQPDHWQRGTALAGILSVVLVGVGLVVTNSFNRDQLALQQESAHEQQDLALKGQRADRFVRAVDQIGQEGDDKLSVRLGGIYALEVLMKEFPADQNVVTEVLCAFVRTHAPWRKDDRAIPDAKLDVRAAITVLGRRLAPETHVDLDFSETALGLNCSNLSKANFRRADLSVSDFTGAKLQHADLRDTDFHNAFLDDADLEGANLEGAVLREAAFHDAKLISVNLRNANLTGAKLTGADLSGADLTDAEFAGADLSGVDLTTTKPNGVTSVQLKCAKLDGSTKLPSGVDRPPAGAWKEKECEVP